MDAIIRTDVTMMCWLADEAIELLDDPPLAAVVPLDVVPAPPVAPAPDDGVEPVEPGLVAPLELMLEAGINVPVIST